VGYGDPILAVDVTRDGTYVLATCATYLILCHVEDADTGATGMLPGRELFFRFCSFRFRFCFWVWLWFSIRFVFGFGLLLLLALILVSVLFSFRIRLFWFWFCFWF
jgi:hypothetical protein